MLIKIFRLEAFDEPLLILYSIRNPEVNDGKSGRQLPLQISSKITADNYLEVEEEQPSSTSREKRG